MDALYNKVDFSDADGERLGALQLDYEEMNGWNADSEAAALLSNLEIKEDLHSTTKLIGVTMLTSFNDKTINEIGLGGSINQNVDNLSKLAFNCGMDGIVCSPLEIKKVKNTYGSKLKIVVPGIRDNTIKIDDQKRTLSAKKAIELGADVIVIGRPITSAESPASSAEMFYQSIQ